LSYLRICLGLLWRIGGRLSILLFFFFLDSQQFQSLLFSFINYLLDFSISYCRVMTVYQILYTFGNFIQINLFFF